MAKNCFTSSGGSGRQAAGSPAGTSTALRRMQTAVARMMLREAADEYLGLARLACEVGDSAPQAPVCRSVLALLDRFDRYQAENPPELVLSTPGSRFPGMHLVVTASIVALTPDVPLPPDPEPESAGERSGE